MGSCSCTSRKVRPLAAAPAAPPPLASLAPSARSCCISFRLSDRPVPSYLAHRTRTYKSAQILENMKNA